MSKHFTHAILNALFVGLVAGAAIAPSNAQAQDSPTVLGKTIGEWSAKWWQWALAIPKSTNPMLDDTGAFAHIGQQGPVWFLAGVWGDKSELVERHCNVPRGKHILFSMANSIWIQLPSDPPEYTEKEYREQASAYLPPSIGGKLDATLDGKSIIFNPKTPIVRSQSPVFTALFPPDRFAPYDNVFEMDPKTLTGDPIVSDGFWVILPPLEPGMHTLHFEAGDPPKQNVTYYLTVGRR